MGGCFDIERDLKMTLCVVFTDQMGGFAGTKALQDAGLSYNEIEQACCGYVYGMTVALHFNIDNNNSGQFYSAVSIVS